MLGRRDEEGEVRPFSDEVEEYSFDDLAKGLASRSVSRRQALWLVGAASLSATLSVVFPGLADAKRRKKKKKKKKKKRRAAVVPTPQCSAGRIVCGKGCCISGQFCCQAANNQGLVCCNDANICAAGGLTCQAVLPPG